MHTIQSNQSLNTPQHPDLTTKMASTSIPTLNCIAINFIVKYDMAELGVNEKQKPVLQLRVRRSYRYMV